MRVIKFRVWNEVKKEMIIPFENAKLGIGLEYYENNIKVSYPMQFTGLIDNNGKKSKEVYEGDILFNTDRAEYQEVIYNDEEARWDVRYSHGEQRSLIESIGNLNIVVGNIHENPELLK